MFSEVIVAKNTGRKGQRRQGGEGAEKRKVSGREREGRGKRDEQTLKIKGGKLVPFRKKEDLVGVL